MFESAARSAGDVVAVFVHDGETGSFYLYAPLAPSGHKVLGALRVASGRGELERAPVEVRWDAAERVVGLFIGRDVWAAFDSGTGAGYAGDYGAGVLPLLPARISAALAAS